MVHIISALLQGIGTELIYSFVIIICSLMIYYSTKEMYELSSYKALKYFRYAFLFFAIAYFFKSFIKFLLVYFGASRIIEINPWFIGMLTLFVFMCFSSLAVFYLVYSLMWKRLSGRNGILGIFYILSIAIAFISITTNQIEILFGVNLFILAIAIFGLYITHKESKNNKEPKRKKKGSNIYLIYALLFIFWILNIIEVLIPNFLQFYQVLVYLASLGVFLTILYKVLKKSGSN
jgi:hypothetical protein